MTKAQKGYQDGDRYRADRTKNGDPHWVYLPPLATEQVDKFETSPTAVQSWLLGAGANANTLPGFHASRPARTFATRLADLGIPPHIIEKCLNHRMQGVMGMTTVPSMRPSGSRPRRHGPTKAPRSSTPNRATPPPGGKYPICGYLDQAKRADLVRQHHADPNQEHLQGEANG